MRDRVCVLLYAIGAGGVLCAAFATDWRAGVAVAGTGVVVGAWVLDDEQEETT